MEKVLITGSNGYVGNALTTTLSRMGNYVYFPIDSGSRKIWVKEVGGLSLTDYPLEPYYTADLSNTTECGRILNYFRPTCIVHLASQPSGPYSEISITHRLFTQVNNLSMLVNLLTVAHELNLDPKWIVTTTTGIPGAPEQPILESPMLNSAGSAYHVSRGFDSSNLTLAARQWKSRILELRTSIIYGTRINNLDEPVTRLDWDFYFGTALHRFCLLKKLGRPLTIYGKGDQRKPIISLRDVVKSILRAIDFDVPSGHQIMNQVTECLSIKEMAETIGGEVTHVPNPRIENESHQMTIHNLGFMKLLHPANELSSQKNGLHTASDENSFLAGEISSILKDMDTSKLPSNWESIYAGKMA